MLTHSSSSIIVSEFASRPAIVNAIARLGYNPDNEYYSTEELIKNFDREKLSKSQSVFTKDTLAKFGRLAINSLTEEEICEQEEKKYLAENDISKDDKWEYFALIDETTH